MVSRSSIQFLSENLPADTEHFRDALLQVWPEAEKRGRRTYGKMWDHMQSVLSWREFIRAGLTEALHEKTIMACHDATEHIDSCDTVRCVSVEIAADKGISEKTVSKWLCQRNPLYETGAETRRERFRRLKAAVECAAFFTQTP